MAARPIWRGHLRLALVSCPVALFPVVRSSSGLHFHFINPATGNRVRMVTQDAETDEELSRADLIRGFEVERGRYVLLDNDDFESARVESSSLLAIDKFVPSAEIDPIYHDSSYYLAPDGDAGGSAEIYAVLRDAIAGVGRVALSRLVLSRRERAVAIAALGRGLVLHTLHEMRDIASADEAFSTVPQGKPAADMIRLARQLIERQSARFEPADIEDRYESRLREVIAAKRDGEDPDPPEAVDTDDGKVIDLMEALRASLGQSGAQHRSGSGGKKANTGSAARTPPRKTSGKATGKPGGGAGKAGPAKAEAAKARPSRSTAASRSASSAGKRRRA